MEFGSVGAVLASRPERLQQVLPLDRRAADCICAARGLMLHALRRAIEDRPLFDHWNRVYDYLHCDMASLTHERVRVLHLDTTHRLIADEIVSEGTVDQANMPAREIIKRALELGSVGLVLVHNHPSGGHTPSTPDIAATRRVMEAAKPFGIAVHDHLVISSTGHTSMRAEHLI